MLTDVSERPDAATLPSTASDASYWDEVGGEWQAAGHQRLWRRHSDAVNLELVRRWVPSGVRRVLKTDLFDEAIGSGLVDLLATRAESVFGVDVAAATASGAVARHPGLRATVADVRSLPYADGTFDVVFSNSTLDHFERAADIDVALRELARVLRPGGELILTLDNLANPVIWLRSVLPFWLLHWTGLVPYYVGATLGPRATEEHVRSAGLDVMARGSVVHCPRVPAVALAGLLDRCAGSAVRQAYLRFLAAFEALGRWPTRYLTGYFVAVRARKPLT